VTLHSRPQHHSFEGATELEDWHIIGGGVGVHWPLIDEDISMAELLAGAY